jgi:hypothetical protein
MTTGLLLTYPFSDATPTDDAEILAHAIERGQRELMWRDEIRKSGEIFAEKMLHELVPARDAGDVCHVCGNLVTWVDHLPPRDPGGAVRCFVNVRTLTPTGGM